MELIKNCDIEYLCNSCGDLSCSDGHYDNDGKLLPSENYPQEFCDAFNSVWEEDRYGYSLYMCRIKGTYYIVTIAEFGDLKDGYRSDKMRSAIINRAYSLEKYGRLHGSKVFFVDDCDDPYCQWELLVATPVLPCPKPWHLREISQDLECFLSYLDICPEENGIDLDRRRVFTVDTPLGQLRVHSKHDPIDNHDFPGVYVDFIPPYPESDPVLLAAVEYDPYENKMQTCVYSDGLTDAPTLVAQHKNIRTYTQELLQRVETEQKIWKEETLRKEPQDIFNASAEIQKREAVEKAMNEYFENASTEEDARILLGYEKPITKITACWLLNEKAGVHQAILKAIQDMR